MIKEVAPPPAPVPMFHEEMQLWKAVATHDLATLRAALAPDFAYLGAKRQDREQIAGIGACEPAKFSFLLPRSNAITPDVILITYRASQDFACTTGHKLGDVNVSSTWVKRDGKWLLQAHTESPSSEPLDPVLQRMLSRSRSLPPPPAH
jgi:Domain of unknown function (DUF4440)